MDENNYKSNHNDSVNDNVSDERNFVELANSSTFKVLQGASSISVNTGAIELYSCGLTKLFVISAFITLTSVDANPIKFVFQNIANYTKTSQYTHFTHFGPDSINSHNYSILVGATSFGIVKNSTWDNVAGNLFTNNTRTRLVCYILFI